VPKEKKTRRKNKIINLSSLQTKVKAFYLSDIKSNKIAEADSSIKNGFKSA
jgi:hypothetical protein